MKLFHVVVDISNSLNLNVSISTAHSTSLADCFFAVCCAGKK
jgi:hypothetical protein